MTSETWYQQCDCKSSASGPRIVVVEQKRLRPSTVFVTGLAKLACDKCDKPWTKDPKPGGWRLTEFTDVGFQ